ncbi:hypothetical protein BS50DRAFT_509500, partial [Corynespora cassiicola Philippines]
HRHAQDLLGQLPHAADAPFNSYARQHEPTCLADTRVDLLNEIHGWTEGQDKRCIFWLRGLAGTGKSTIARTVARRYDDKQRLAASFFFSRGGGDVGHAAKFVTSIAVQLAHSVPVVRQHISDAVEKRRGIASQSLRDQWQHLVLAPLSKLREPGPYVVVVDALDECDNDDDVQIVVQLLAEARSLERVRLRVFLTSRPELPIRHVFGQMEDADHKDVALHDISPLIVRHDIATFLKHQLKMIARDYDQADDWPGAEVIELLVQNASGLFIWAATACRFIREGGQFVADRLRAILKDSSLADHLSKDSSSSDNSSTDDRLEVLPKKRLDNIYLTVLKSPVRKYRKKERKKWYRLIKETLGAIILLLSPFSASSIAKLLLVPADDVHRTLGGLHSILDVPKDPLRLVRLHHPSFRDFLLDKKRCDDNFWVDEKTTHERLASCCLDLMSAPNGLRQDICDLSEPGVLRSEIDESRVAARLPPELQYACRYWVDHLERSQRSIEDEDATHHFLQRHLLHWLEAMSLINETSLCVRLVASFIVKFLHDAHRFVLRFVSTLADAPLQIYLSGLAFSPEASIVRRAFNEQVRQEVRVVLGRDAEWDACHSVLEGHSGWVKAVVFSPDSQLVASASDDSTVRVWETATGRCRSVLKGHSRGVNAVVFSPNGKLVASASDDSTVRVWETATGRCRSVLKGHSDEVKAVMFSPDGQLVVSASWDGTVRVWETATGQRRSVLKGHSDWVKAVVFSPDGQLVASSSYDRTVRVWETATGQRRSVLEGHLYGVNAVVFSPNGKLVASASDDRTVRVWEAATGQYPSVLKEHLEEVRTVVFSPDGQTLRTDKGDIPLPSGLIAASTALPTQNTPYAKVESQWVLRQDRRFLWLPPEYRGCITKVYKHMICLGCKSGRIALLCL